MTDQNQTEQLPETPGRNAASCTRPPAGWLCSRGLNHDGPCAAKRASCEIPNASGRWSCDDEWGHTGDLHWSACDGYYSQQHIVAHHARQATRREYDDEQSAKWDAPDRRLDQAQLREQAQQTGGGVDERRQRGEPTTTQVRTALPPKEFAPIPPCRECGLKVTHKRGCTLAFGYVAPEPYEPGETMKNVRAALAPKAGDRIGAHFEQAGVSGVLVCTKEGEFEFRETRDAEAEIGKALQERVVDLQGRLAFAKWAMVLFMCTTVAATAWAVWLGGWPW